jgi:hypothetical protein
VSLRSDILGWVIRRLGEIDAADEARRADLFRTLRTEISSEGFGGAAPAEALPHFESAVAIQEAHWLREVPARPAPPPPSPQPKPEHGTPPAKPWVWPARLKTPAKPPGPAPGPATGPFADHLYEIVLVDTPGGPAEFNIGWTFDPACVLTAVCESIGFRFQTRAATFGHAAAHLADVLKLGGLELPPSFLHRGS